MARRLACPGRACARGHRIRLLVAASRPRTLSSLGGQCARGLVAALHGVHARGLWSLRRRLHRLCDLHHRLPARRRGIHRRGRHTLLVDIWAVFGRRRVRVGARPRPAERRLGNGRHTQRSHDRNRGAARSGARRPAPICPPFSSEARFSPSSPPWRRSRAARSSRMP